ASSIAGGSSPRTGTSDLSPTTGGSLKGWMRPASISSGPTIHSYTWDRYTTDCYLREISRVLTIDGRAVIHHAGRMHAFLWLRFVRHLGRIGKKLYHAASMRKLTGDDGWRSDMSRQLFRKLAVANMLTVEAQLQSWGKNEEFGIPRFGDWLSILAKR